MPDQVSTRPQLDKLGIRPGARVAVIGVDDADFRALLDERTSDVSEGAPPPDTDLVFLAADSAEQLTGLAVLRGAIRPKGAIWVVSRKGRGATIRDVDVMVAAKSAGLVDNKVVSFSETHTALRLVVPIASRPR